MGKAWETVLAFKGSEKMKKIQKQEFQITEQAFKAITEETLKNPGPETGGIMIGLLREKVILEAGGPGPRASKGMSHYSPDVEHDQALLDRAKARYGERATFLGYWHRHPENSGIPSGGDLEQAREILKDFRNGGNNEYLLSVITTFQ